MKENNIKSINAVTNLAGISNTLNYFMNGVQYEKQSSNQNFKNKKQQNLFIYCLLFGHNLFFNKTSQKPCN